MLGLACVLMLRCCASFEMRLNGSTQCGGQSRHQSEGMAGKRVTTHDWPQVETVVPRRTWARRCAQVIEMTSVSSASDIWSVGCLAIELLTGNPPYSELQPMSAMFRVVQDAHPPLPKGISQPMLNFLMQCFQKVSLTSPRRRLTRLPQCVSSSRTACAAWSASH